MTTVTQAYGITSCGLWWTGREWSHKQERAKPFGSIGAARDHALERWMASDQPDIVEI